MSKKIKIFDTTLRDGEQSPGASMSIEQKIEIAYALENLGVDRIEAGFPISSPVQFEAVNKIGKITKNATIVGLARCIKKDIDAVNEALDNAKNKMIHIFIATSPLHRDFKLKKSKKQILQSIIDSIGYAKKFFKHIEFSAEDGSRTELDFILEVVRTAIAAGATTVNIPDTVGYAIPSEFGYFIGQITKNVPELKEKNINLSVHCHNDLGLAVANSIEAVKNGATQVEVTLNGIGERAGNCPLEELIMTFNVRKDLLDFETGINTELLYPSSKLLQSVTGLIIPRNKPIFGENVFSHESGIHQDGVLKHRETYEIMKPSSIGRSNDTIVMGRHSGMHAFKNKLKSYNVKLSEEQLQEAFKLFTKIADKKKEVYDEDIFDIVSRVLGRFKKGFEIKYFHSYTGNTILPSATVKLIKGTKEFVSTAAGDGPVDAVFQAIDSAIKIKCKLIEYVIQAVGNGKNALGQVKLVLRIDGDNYVGKGSSTDIVEASAYAYLNAINRSIFRTITNKQTNFQLS